MNIKSILTSFLCAYLSLVACAALADSSAPPLGVPKIKMETPYEKVREIMLKNGWRPYRGQNALPCTLEDKRCQGRPEMQACSDVGIGQCSWLWKKNGRIVLIKTQDDDLFYGFSRYYGH
ncbi:hypothetical protein LK423_17870 [Burkholderia dolosa]|nr:hypothetical protein LK423_17870 [Burkholderia dolosa]UEC16043.1 hypothetical protein LK445_14550 [Burkholderia dolosa]